MKRTIFIGQAMPRIKKHPHDWPSLNSWLYSVGITDEQIKENFLYSALVDYFPGSFRGSHKVPTQDEIAKERKRLVKTITGFNPQIVVPVGKLSISHCLNQEVKTLADFIGKIYCTCPYGILNNKIVVIPLPHPSGASTWYKKPENNKLLIQALTILKNNLLRHL
jgi:uracil-DNA glycosylase